MHQSAARAISKFYFDFRSYIDSSQVADMGALNLNGSTKDVIRHAVGFDIVAGPGVDVVIEPGRIPAEHRQRYGLVTSISSFTFCPHPAVYKQQIIDLLHPQGYMLLSMCSDKCRFKHTTSNNTYGFGDEFRMTRQQVEDFFGKEFKILELNETNYEHPDFVVVGKLK